MNYLTDKTPTDAAIAKTARTLVTLLADVLGTDGEFAVTEMDYALRIRITPSKDIADGLLFGMTEEGHIRTYSDEDVERVAVELDAARTGLYC